MNFIKRIYHNFGYRGKYLDLRYKEFKLQVFRVSVVFFIGIILILYTFYISLLSDHTTILNFIGQPYMKSISYVHEDNNITKNIAIVCSEFDSEEKKVRCVHNFVKEFHNYDEHRNETKIFRRPEEIINFGGCCRDFSYFYSSIFNQMGLETEFVFEPTHVYLVVHGERDYEIDQTFLEILNNSLAS